MLLDEGKSMSLNFGMKRGSIRYLPLSIACSIVCCLWLSVGSSAFSQVHTPEPGTDERTAILDAVRDPLEDSIHQKVIFVVDHMKVDGDWAFIMATPKTKDGGQINYKGTVFEEDADFGDELTVALIRKKRGRWYIVTHGYFTTDVWWERLWEKYDSCPESIFPKY